jgi:N-acetylglucosamine-6-phosphate deacetylase
LITDAISGLGLSDGQYQLGAQEVSIKEGTAYVAGTDTLAGSVISLDAAVRNLQKVTGCSIVEAIECASFKPAKLLGISDKKGTLQIGADADIVILDRNLQVQACYIGGNLAYSK